MDFRLEQQSEPVLTSICESCGEGVAVCPVCENMVHWFFAAIRVEIQTARQYDCYRPFCGCMVLGEAQRSLPFVAWNDYARDPLEVLANHADYRVRFVTAGDDQSVIIESSKPGPLLPWDPNRPDEEWDPALGQLPSNN